MQILSPKISDLAERFARALPKCHANTYRCRTLTSGLGHIRIARLKTADLVRFRDARAEHVGPQSIHHEINLLRTIIRTARTDWGLKIPDHTDTFRLLTLPRVEGERDRRLAPEEQAALWAHAGERLRLAMEVALETGMRRGELCALTWEMVDLDGRTITLPRQITKTRRKRAIPMSRKLVQVMVQIEPKAGSVTGYTANGINLAWQRARTRAAEDCQAVLTFHWHDFRHECLSRLAERGWTPPQMQVVSGHADWRMLQRYVNLRAEDLLMQMDH